jgi:hypothetical protein
MKILNNHFLIIIAFNILLYWRIVVKGGYIIDDVGPRQRRLKRVKEIKDFLPSIWRSIRGREYLNERYEHTFNLVIHIINCILVYLVFRRVVGDVTSFLAAILFACSPINHQISMWISGRGYGISSILILLSWWFPLLGFALYPVSLRFFAVNVMGFPLMFLITPIWWLVPVFALGFPAGYHQWMEKTARGINDRQRRFRLSKLIIVAKTYGYYFRQCLFPIKTTVYNSFMQYHEVVNWAAGFNYKLNHDFWSGILAIIGAGTVITLHLPGWYGLVWFTVFILPFCNFITISMPYGDRYAYTASIGIALFIAQAFPLAVPYIIGAYCIRTWFIIPMYRSDYWYKEMSLVEDCRYMKSWLFRGRSKWRSCDYSGALQDFLEAQQMYPLDFKANFDCAAMLTIIGAPAEALEHLTVAENNLYNTPQIEEHRAYCKRLRNVIEEAKRTGRLNIDSVPVVV